MAQSEILKLLPPEAIERFNELNKKLVDTQKGFVGLLPQIQAVDASLSKMSLNYKDLSTVIDKVNNIEKQQDTIKKQVITTYSQQEKLIKQLALAQSEEAKQNAILKEQIRQKNVELKNEAKINLAAKDSLDQLTAASAKLTRQYLSMSETMRKSAYGKYLKEDIDILDAKISEHKVL